MYLFICRRKIVHSSSLNCLCGECFFLQLQENLLQHVNSLVRDPGSDFWRTGRFLIHTDRQLASHKDGNCCQFRSHYLFSCTDFLMFFFLW